MSTPASQAIAKRDAEQPTIGQLIQQLKPELERALPKHMDGDRMARLALTVLRQTPALAQTNPQSFAGALLTAAALGLEPGVNGEAYLVPYKRECQLIIGYQGMAKLFWQHPMAAYLDAQAVYEKDQFDYAYGLDPYLKHKPAIGDRGQVVAYYAVAKLTTGASSFVVLSPDQVKELRSGKVGPKGDIKDPERWMERKTVLRQLVKLLPRSTQLNHALVADERSGTDLASSRIPEAITGGEPAVDPQTGEVLDGELVDDPNSQWDAPNLDGEGGE